MTKKGNEEGGKKILVQNKKARFEYHIIEKFEAGIVLTMKCCFLWFPAPVVFNFRTRSLPTSDTPHTEVFGENSGKLLGILRPG